MSKGRSGKRRDQAFVQAGDVKITGVSNDIQDLLSPTNNLTWGKKAENFKKASMVLFGIADCSRKGTGINHDTLTYILPRRMESFSEKLDQSLRNVFESSNSVIQFANQHPRQFYRFAGIPDTIIDSISWEESLLRRFQHH